MLTFIANPMNRTWDASGSLPKTIASLNMTVAGYGASVTKPLGLYIRD